MPKFYVYVIEGLSGFTYIGQTNNIEDRLLRHNGGREKSTKNHRPFKIIHIEEFDNRSRAMRREKSLKSGQGREWMHSNLLNK